MAFFIKTKQGYSNTFYKRKPTMVFNDEISFFQADGDELESIRQQFENIPITKGNICAWTGEMAQFIFYNL